MAVAINRIETCKLEIENVKHFCTWKILYNEVVAVCTVRCLLSRYRYISRGLQADYTIGPVVFSV